MKEIEIIYYKFPLYDIPFKDIPSLEDFDLANVYCSSISLYEFEFPYYLISVYDFLENVEGVIPDLSNLQLLFGRIISDKLTIRGKVKCIKLKTVLSSISEDDLPHLKYTPSRTQSENANWFYTKGCKYWILSAIESTYQNVRHLEDNVIYGYSIIRLRIVIELLKRNIKKGIITLSEADYKDIAYRVLKSDPAFRNSDEELIWCGINNWIPMMVKVPLFTDIPEEIREKVAL